MAVVGLLVVDIGKTNLKLSVLDDTGATRFSRSIANRVIWGDGYSCFDVDATWSWMLSTMKEAARASVVSHVCVATHGAAAAVVNTTAELSEDRLCLPVMDYEWDGVREFDRAFDALRPDFQESYSPGLPTGLNLARQLYWQSRRFPKAFAAATHILPYAQFWSWRLCGVAATEVSALGSHTDLWSPTGNTWSSLVERLGWRDKFAPIQPASAVLGNVLPAVAEATGLAPDCVVLTGVHDSNASYARFLGLPTDELPTVISTGTWTVLMHPRGDLTRLDEQRDMLANVDVTGVPIACARFMGGREFSEICTRTGCETGGECSVGDVQDIVTEGHFAWPSFGGESGPFGRQRPRITGAVESGLALASLYAALMIDFELDLLAADGAVVIDGSFANNEMLCRLVATLRPGNSVARLTGSDGVAQGCLRIAQWDSDQYSLPGSSDCKPLKLVGLDEYRAVWRYSSEEDNRGK